MKYNTPVARSNTSDSEPPKRRKQAERTALSDRLLTEAAIELLVKHGLQGTTLQGVGERAGYSRGLATHRFGSKAGLFAKVLESQKAYAARARSWQNDYMVDFNIAYNRYFGKKKA